MPAELTFYIPGLLGPLRGLDALPASEWPKLPALEILVSRSERRAVPAPPGDRVLFALFPFQQPDGDPPVAALTRIYDGGMPDEEWWVRADPVYLHADPDRMVLAAHGDLGLQPEEAAALSQTLAEHLAEEGWRLEMRAPERWYVQVSEAPRLTTHSPGTILGRDIAGFLPQGQDAPHWRRVMNELQMLLHAHPVNAARESRGQPPVNSVWFWGGGRMPQVGSSAWEGVWSDALLPRALASHAGSAEASLPDDASGWLRGLAGRHLVVIDTPWAPLRQRDVLAWFARLEAVEQEWLAPALAALRAGRVRSLRLVTDTGADLRLTRRRLWHWWKRRARLRHILGG